MQRRMLASLGLGAALLIGSPALWSLSQAPTDVGDPAAFAAPTHGDERARDAEPVATDDAGTDAPEDVDVPSALAEPGEPSSAAAVPRFTVSERRGPVEHVPAPDRVRIPSLRVDAPVIPVGLEPDGTLEIPTDVATIGWFEPGVRPGQAGSAVLSGHVDSRSQGRGAFFRLRDLEVGDEVVIGAGGDEQRWSVIARQRFPKDELPVAELFSREGDPRLVLITCGGGFDASSRSYTDNVVVIAVPI